MTPALWVWVSLGLSGIALVLAIAAVLSLRSIYYRLDAVTPDVRSLAQRLRDATGEEALKAVFSHLETNARKVAQLEVGLSDANRALSRTLRRMGLVRFDAADDIRGELSFALCLLDDAGDGFLLTSLYSLQECRVFLRAVAAGETEHALMQEEAQALAQALEDW